MLLERYGLKDPNRKGGSQENCDNQESAYITLYESIEKAKQAWIDAKKCIMKLRKMIISTH